MVNLKPNFSPLSFYEKEWLEIEVQLMAAGFPVLPNQLRALHCQRHGAYIVRAKKNTEPPSVHLGFLITFLVPQAMP
jgi:hypothetical protein